MIILNGTVNSSLEAEDLGDIPVIFGCVSPYLNNPKAAGQTQSMCLESVIIVSESLKQANVRTCAC